MSLAQVPLLAAFTVMIFSLGVARAHTPNGYALSPDGTVLRFFEPRGTWLPLGRPFAQLFEGGGRVFAVHQNHDIYELDVARSRAMAVPPSSLELWTRIGQAGQQFIVDEGGQLCGISPGQGAVWCYRDRPMDWQQVGGAMAKLLVHGNTLYGIRANSDGSDGSDGILRYEGRPYVWTRLDAPPPQIAIDVLRRSSTFEVEAVSTDGPQKKRRCYYTRTIARRCTGVPYDTRLDTQSIDICNGCLVDAHCTERRGGRCVDIAGFGCGYASKACAYPKEPCYGRGASGCPSSTVCLNINGRATCGPFPQSPP